MFIKKKRNCRLLNSGQSVVELVMVLALLSILIPALWAGLIAARSGKAQQEQRLKATALMKEAEEAARSYREAGWDNFYALCNGSKGFPVLAGNHWEINTTTDHESVQGFDRRLSFEHVLRTGNIIGPITLGPTGVTDPSLCRVTATVSWDNPPPFHYQVQSVFYLSRYLDNMSLTQTTVNDFNAGQKTDVVVTDNNGGEVSLGIAGPGFGDWCSSNIAPVKTVDLYGQGIAKTVGATYLHAYAGTGNNASGPDATGITLTDPGVYPPNLPDAYVAWQTAQTTNDKVNDIYANGNYAYLATNRNAEEIIVLDYTQGGKKVTSFDLPGPQSAMRVFVKGNIGYALQGGSLYTFDADPSRYTDNYSRPPTAAFALGGAGLGIKVTSIGGIDYAFVAVGSTTNQMEIWKVNNINNLQRVSTFHVNGGAGRDLDVSSNGSLVFLVTAAGSGNDFFIINTQNPASPSLLSVQTVPDGTDPIRVDMVLTKGRAIIVGSGTTTYWVYNTEDLTAPVNCASLKVGTKVYDVSSVEEPDGDAFAYIVTDNANAEFQIILGGGGNKMATSGTFESETLPVPYLTNQALFNRFIATYDQPSNSMLKFRVAVVNADPVTGCAGADFSNAYVGPSGDPNSTDPNDYFYNSTGGTGLTLAAPIPFPSTDSAYKNPGMCFRYKVWFTASSDAQSPILDDFTINYTP